MKIDPVLRDAASWGVFGIIAVGVGYALIKWGIPAIAKAAANSAASAAGSLTQGAASTVNAVNQGLQNNAITNSQTDVSGSSVNYSGYGPASTLGAETNYLSGGTLASAGESIGSGLFSWFNGPNAGNGSSITYMVTFPDGSRHGVDSSSVDANNRFTYGGNQYILGDDGSGNKLATALTTVYGSGSGGGIPTDFGVDPNSWG